jgi:Flp pilus assembly pilin Flp
VSGQSSVEYGLLVAVLAILVLVGVTKFGGTIHAWFEGLGQLVTSAR